MADQPDNTDDDTEDQPQQPAVVINNAPPSPNQGLYDAALTPPPVVAPPATIAPAQSANTATPGDLNQLQTNLAKQPPAAPAGPKNPTVPTDSSTSQPQQQNPYGEEQGIMQGAAQAVKNIGGLEAQKYKDQEQAAQQNLQNTQDTYDKFTTLNKSWEDESDKAIQDVRNNHINPNHYMESMSTPQRVSTAVGMLIAGMGSGLLRQENPVSKYLDQQINRDIESQVSNMNQGNNIVSMLARQTGNKRAAIQLATALQNKIYADKITQIGLQYGSPEAAQNAKVLAAPYLEKAASLGAAGNMMLSMQNGQSSADPARQLMLMKQLGKIDDKQYEKANDQLDNINEIESLRSNIQDSFNDLNGKLLAGKLSPSDRQSAINSYSGLLVKVAEGRFNFDEAKQQMEAILPGIEGGETRENKLDRLNKLFDTLRSKNGSILRGIGINVPSKAQPSVPRDVRK